jgi:excinuclease UvrABC nuclease subunit
MIVFDGGVGQKNIGEQVLANLNILVNTCSVVKDDRHKARDILGLDNLNLKLTKVEMERLKKSVLLANSEAHRFAISYHKDKREEKFLGREVKF